MTVALICVALPFGTAAHELWIEPEQYQVDNGSAIRGNFKNGEDFKGNSLSYFDRSSERFELALGAQIRARSYRRGLAA